MMQLLTKYLPYLILLYFLFRAYKQPIYLLGIPFLIFFQYCIFFENVKIFAVPGSLPKDIILLIWMFIVWFVLSARSLIMPGCTRTNYYQSNGINVLDLIISALMIISVTGLAIVVDRNTVITGVVKQFFILTSLFLGYFIVKRIVCYTDVLSLKDFLFSIVLVNSGASVLYFLHQGLHLQLYQLAGMDVLQQEVFQGEIITREFWCMPVLWFFSVAYLIVFRPGKLAVTLSLLGLNFLAVFVSYTRSFVAIIFVLVFLYTVLVSLKKRSLGTLLKNGIAVILASTVIIVGILRMFPDKFEYFAERIVDLKRDPSDESSNTLLIRFTNTGEIFHKLGPEKTLAGVGPVTEAQYLGSEEIDDASADMVWTGVVFRWGYIGLALFILLYLVSLLKAFSLFMRRDGILSKFGLVLFLTIVSQVGESFTSWTFLNPGHLAMGLWYFAFLSALSGFNKTYDVQLEKVDNEQAWIS
jgi:hypothetical protein